MSIGEGVGSPGPTPLDEPLHAYLTRRTGAWDARMRLEALAAVIACVYRLTPEVIDAAERRDVDGFDRALRDFVLGLSWDAAQVARPDDTPLSAEPPVPAP